MVYLIDDKYLFTGDTIWFGADGGYSFISSLAEDNRLAVQVAGGAGAEALRARHSPAVHHRSHRLDGQFRIRLRPQRSSSARPSSKRVPDPTAPYDAYDESDDTSENAKARISERALDDNRPLEAGYRRNR